MRIRACQQSDSILDGKVFHGIYRGGYDVLVRAKMTLGATSVNPRAPSVQYFLLIGFLFH